MDDSGERGPIDPTATYTLREAADLADLSRERLRTAMVEGTLPAIQNPDGWRVVGTDLATWIESRNTELPAVPAGCLPASHVAGRASVNPATVYRAITRGDLPAHWDGRHWLVRDEDAATWLAQRTPPAST
jgi:excisionase family DNA binding protein